MAAAASGGVDRWQQNLSELMVGVGGRFFRPAPRRHAQAFAAGLLAGLPRTNCPAVAEHAGQPAQMRWEHLLAAAVPDAGGLRDDLRDYVIGELADPGAILAVDETGFVKKGTRSAGVARQYTGTTGKIDNCQVGVFLS